MSYYDKPIKRRDNEGEDKWKNYSYDENIDKAKMARDSSHSDTDPMIEKDGYLGMDDLDKMRRRKIK